VFRPLWTDPSTDATVIDLAAARVVTVLHGEHAGVATAIDATRIATADRSQIRIWELGSWRLLATLAAHTSSVHNLMFLPDGRIVSAANDLRVLIWGTDYALIAALPTAGVRVYDMDATDDGALLVTDGADGAARVWDTTTYRELLRLPSHHQALERVALTRDGQRLLTGGADGRVVTWELARPVHTQAELDHLVHCRVPLRLDGDLALPRELDLHDPTCQPSYTLDAPRPGKG
jgi:WD40 repeat protein